MSGIGLNLNQVEFNSENATSLKVFSGLEYDPEEELERILIHIEQMYIKLRNSRFEFLKDYYLKRLFRKDEWHRFRDLEGSEFSGCIRDIDESGRLIVESDQQIRKFNFKEIEFIS